MTYTVIMGMQIKLVLPDTYFLIVSIHGSFLVLKVHSDETATAEY
jgi:hypothetical protein